MALNFSIDHLDILRIGPSVSEVASFIAGGISLLHLAFPLTLAGLLLSFVHTKEYNAATWSAIGRQVQKSGLPTALFSDGGISFVLAPGVFFICLLSIIITTLLPIAGFLTPLPLTDELGPSIRTTDAEFQYVPDTSYYGQGSLNRTSSLITRACNHGQLWGDCPGSTFDNEAIRTQYAGHIVVNTTIPDSTQQPFDLPSSAQTVAGPFDIEYRNWYDGKWMYLDNGASRQAGFPRPLSSFVLSEGYRLVEGLIIDTETGAIGLRNHTMPIGMTLGAEWEEDILWIEPVTECTATNLSLHFSVSNDFFSEKDYGYLRDDGGFGQLSVPPPGPRWDDDNNNQDNWRVIDRTPDLKGRADVAAWWNNRFVADQLGIESSQQGQAYYGELETYAKDASPSSIAISAMNGQFLDNNFFETNSSNMKNFTAYGYRCSGYDDPDPSPATKAYVRCGYLYSVPVPLDEQVNPSRRYDLGSNWTQQVYTCASSVKASIKTVKFRSNGTLSLEGLTVQDVQPKTYTAGNLPKWAVENAWGYMVSDLNLFWGLTNAAMTNSSAWDVIEAEEFYLPAMGRGYDFGNLMDTFAAGTAFGATWNSVYAYAAAVRGSSLNWIPSYSGENDYAQTQKWRQLSRTSEGAAKVLNLIWMDLAASAVVGTITGFETKDGESMIRQRDDSSSVVLGTRTVRRLVHRVGYSNILYAIPAMILGGIAVLTMSFLLIMICCGKVYLRLMKFYTNQVCVGRAITQWEIPGVAAPDASSSEWKKTAGKRILKSIPEMPSKGQTTAKQYDQDDDTSIDERARPGQYAAGSYVMSNLGGIRRPQGLYQPVQQNHY